uniref:Uncharacterized protein n=1 Tax=Pseudo-nitzschia australis TaxID=44445 RepID=A0A7S4AT69_9STRA|mmetsp:Transcript_2830/g.6022  ORF Transcript_2830/g.6022 Transcript_2830/m.6022 type:complete len:108 (-) Transcript_2830:31-354(-)
MDIFLRTYLCNADLIEESFPDSVRYEHGRRLIVYEVYIYQSTDRQLPYVPDPCQGRGHDIIRGSFESILRLAKSVWLEARNVGDEEPVLGRTEAAIRKQGGVSLVIQ